MQGAETRSILSVMVLAQHLRPILNATTSPLFARLYHQLWERSGCVLSPVRWATLRKKASARLLGRSPALANHSPWWALIISSICFFTASRLNEAGSCIGG